MTRSAVTSGKAKQATFKQAFDAISRYRDEGNFLADYVVKFSIIEDRVKA